MSTSSSSGNLIPGNVAPNITGKDTEGVEFSLEEYRGNIVAVIFTGQWCGPCRGEYPYHRFVLENYGDRPIVLLGVNSDAELETARQAKIDENLPYRTWWDGHSQPDAEAAATDGPIATAWNVTGWPQHLHPRRRGRHPLRRQARGRIHRRSGRAPHRDAHAERDQRTLGNGHTGQPAPTREEGELNVTVPGVPRPAPRRLQRNGT